MIPLNEVLEEMMPSCADKNQTVVDFEGGQRIAWERVQADSVG